MKKYKLLKDTPCAKAGEICKVSHYDGKEIMSTDEGFTAMCADDLEHIRSYEEFDEWFEEVDDKPWEPKDGEKYFYIPSETHCLDENSLFAAIFHDYNKKDEARLSIGNCFRTREDAEKAVEKLKALKRLRGKGFAFKQWRYIKNIYDEGKVEIMVQAVLDDDAIPDDVVREDLNLLFEEKK